MKKLAIILVVFVAIAALAGDVDITTLAGLTDVLLTSPSDGQVLTFDAPSSKWKNKAPASPTVAQTSFLNETSDVALTTIYTPTVTGTYRISEYGISSINGSQAIPMVLGWTDDVGAQSTDSNRGTAVNQLPAVSSGAYNTNTFVVRAVSGTAITFKTTCGCALNTGSFFDVFVTVEKL